MLTSTKKPITIGTWSQIASAEVIDIVGAAGFAFTIVDCEHGFFGLETAEGLFRACDAVGVTPWVRAPTLDPVWISRAFDAGARRVVVPSVGSAEDAARAVAAGRFAPDGTRGACPCVRAGQHFIRDWRAYARKEAAETGVAIIVETKAGLDDFDRIITTEGLAALVIGPFDLSVSLGYEGDYRRTEVQDAVKSMIRRAIQAGVEVVMPVFSPDIADARGQLEHWRGQGVHTFIVGTDKILIADQFSRTVAGLSGAAMPAGGI